MVALNAVNIKKSYGEWKKGKFIEKRRALEEKVVY